VKSVTTEGVSDLTILHFSRFSTFYSPISIVVNVCLLCVIKQLGLTSLHYLMISLFQLFNILILRLLQTKCSTTNAFAYSQYRRIKVSTPQLHMCYFHFIYNPAINVITGEPSIIKRDVLENTLG